MMCPICNQKTVMTRLNSASNIDIEDVFYDCQNAAHSYTYQLCNNDPVNCIIQFRDTKPTISFVQDYSPDQWIIRMADSIVARGAQIISDEEAMSLMHRFLKLKVFS